MAAVCIYYYIEFLVTTNGSEQELEVFMKGLQKYLLAFIQMNLRLWKKAMLKVNRLSKELKAGTRTDTCTCL